MGMSHRTFVVRPQRNPIVSREGVGHLELVGTLRREDGSKHSSILQHRDQEEESRALVGWALLREAFLFFGSHQLMVAKMNEWAF